MNGSIYTALTPDNKMYVGQTRQVLSNRISQHIRYSKKHCKSGGLSEAIRTYGDEIKWGVVVSGIENSTALTNMETFYINLKDTYANGLNLTKIGNTTYGARFKRGSSWNVGRTMSEHTKEQLRKSNLGRKWTDDQREKFIKDRTGKYVGKNNQCFGRTGKLSARSKTILVDGVIYYGITEASRITGIKKGKIDYGLKVGKYRYL